MTEHREAAHYDVSNLISWLQNGGVLIEPVRTLLHALTRKPSVVMNDDELRDMIGKDQRFLIDNIATQSSSAQERCENVLMLLRRVRDRYEERVQPSGPETNIAGEADEPLGYPISRAKTARMAKTWIIRVLSNLGLDEPEKQELRTICGPDPEPAAARAKGEKR